MPRWDGTELTALLLDLDDTILDGQAGLERTWNAISAFLSERLGDIAPDAVQARFRETSEWFWSDDDRHRRGRLDLLGARREIVSRVLVGLGRSDADLAHEIARAYCERRDRDLVLLDGALDAVTQLRDRFGALGLVTNGASDAQRAKIDRFDLERFFDVIIVEGEFGAGKPERAVFEHATRTLGSAPDATLMVGDNYECDVLGALDAGLHAVWIERRGRPAPASAPRPHRTLRSLVELLPELED